MMASIQQKLTSIINNAQSVLDDVGSDNLLEQNEAIRELIDACLTIESYYKTFCNECDEDWGEKPGTCYNQGVSMEFYIESDWWHDASLALRKLEGKF